MINPTVFWMKQTIGSACGMMGIIPCVGELQRESSTPESPLANFVEECHGKTPLERAKILETTPLFAQIHSQAASGGQSTVPPDLYINLHFTCVVKAPNPPRIESVVTDEPARLDGRRTGPIDRGVCEDLLQDVTKYVKEHHMEFSMIALGPSQPA